MGDITGGGSGGPLSTNVEILEAFLKEVGLPTENIIAPKAERDKISANLPSYIKDMPADAKHDARYLSKFVVGAGLGLFDYALNSVWNEVVLALRSKAITYGIEIFFDAAAGGNLREQYKKEEDLAGLKDVVLLDTSKKLELITETTHKKLAHILDMRNDIGISHPTDHSIKAFELLGWLETCVGDVLNDKPSPAAIQVKSFIDNLRKCNDVLDEKTIKSMEPHIKTLSTQHCANILVTIFGIFVSPEVGTNVMKNISMLAPVVWGCCADEVKYKLGITLEGYNNNLHVEKYNKGQTFFNACNGNKYKSPSERIVALEALSTELLDKHRSRDNFYHEPAVIEKVVGYVQSQSDLPEQIAPSLIRTIMMCRIGRGVSYYEGVSPGGRKYYDAILAMLGDRFAPIFIKKNLADYDVQRKLGNDLCANHCKAMVGLVKQGVVSDRILECLTYLEDKMPGNCRAVFDTKFKQMSSPFVSW
jgi:hypothetical protein